jgi:hypothetical protein
VPQRCHRSAIGNSVWMRHARSVARARVARRAAPVSQDPLGDRQAVRLPKGLVVLPKRRHPRPGDTWHLAEVFLTIHKERHYLWRAVDQDGHMLDILVQRRRDKHAAKKFFRKPLKGLRSVPRVIITDKLRSYGAGKQEILPRVLLQKSKSAIFGDCNPLKYHDMILDQSIKNQFLQQHPDTDLLTDCSSPAESRPTPQVGQRQSR